MRNKKSFLAAAADIFSLPPEIIEDKPLITLVGGERLTVENYLSLTEYTTEKIRIKTKAGVLAIAGAEIAIEEISGDEISLRGSFKGICYED